MSEEKIIVTSGGRFTSILTFVIAILIVGGIIVGYLAYKKMMEENIKLKNEITEFKHVTDTLARSSTKWVTKKDLQNDLKGILTKGDLKKLKQDISKQSAQLSAVGRTVGTLSKKVSKSEKSDSVGPVNEEVKKCSDGSIVDVHSYTKSPQTKKLSDVNDAALAKVTFNAAKRKPWSYEVFKRNFYLATIISKKESGQLVFHHNLQYSVPDVDKDKKYKMKILSSEFKQVQLGNRMFWLNPKLDANFFAGGRAWKFSDGPGRPNSILSMGIEMGLTLSSYGETKVSSLWRFFRFGLGYDIERKAAHFSFAPATLNIAMLLPLLTNFWLAPTVSLDTAGGLLVNFGVGFQL